MKILMVLEHEFPPDIRVEKEALSLIDAGHEVHLACSTTKHKPPEEKYKGIYIHHQHLSVFTYKSSIGCLNFPFYFNFWRNFTKHLFKKYSFDIIHIHDLPLAQIGIEIKKKHNIPFILDLHENYPSLLEEAQHTKTFLGNIFFSSKQWRKYEAYCTKQADNVITVVQEMKNRIINLGIASEKIIVLENTPDLEELISIPSKPKSNKIHLIYVGGLNIHRGLQIIIRGLPPVIQEYPSLVLDIYGSGRYFSILQQLGVEHKISKHINFHGSIRQEQVFEMISLADIALVPHLKSEQTDNSSPNKLYQYLLMDKFVIASDCDSISRVIKESKCGSIYQHNSPKDFSEKLLKALDQQRHLSPCLNGKELLYNKYNWEKSSEALITSYHSFSNQKSK